MSGHVRDHAAFLASLSSDDPERVAAELHATECVECRQALAEGERLFRLVSEALPTPPPTPEHLKKTATLVEIEISRERRKERALGLLVAAGVALSWVFQISLDYSTASTDPRRVAVSLSVLGVAIVAVSVTKTRRGLALAALVGTSGLLAQAAGSVRGLEPTIGAHCTLWELLAAAIPYTLAAVAAKRWHGSFSRADAMTVAAAGALAAQAAQHLTCPVFHADAHLLIFHFGGVLLVALAGALGQAAQRTRTSSA